MSCLPFRALVPLSLTLLLAACGDSTPTAPSETPRTPVVESFTGTLNRNGAFTHEFATDSGAVTVTLVALDPDPEEAAYVGLALGTWNGVACQEVIANDNAGVGGFVIGTATTAGTLCVRVRDVGGITGPTAYSVEVSHF